MQDSRRDFIKKAALLTGAAGLSNLLPASIQKALAINPAPGSTYLDAEHVVLLMQENRSFDHCFGSLRGVRGYNDPRAIDLPNKNKVWLQSNDKGETYAPFHLDIKNTKATWMSNLPHNWRNQVNARNDGKFDKWLESKRSGTKEYADMPLTMGYHTRQDIPFNYALADAFTVCDQNFCSSLTGTNPNRLYFWSGTIRAEQNENSRALVWNEDADYGTLNWKTFPERLEDNGISWKCYQNEMGVDSGVEGEEWLSNFGDNALEYFAQYNVKLHKQHLKYLRKRLNDLPGEIDNLQKQISSLPDGDTHLTDLNKKLKQKKQDLEEIRKDNELYNEAAFDKLSEHEKSIHRKACDTNINDPYYHELSTLTYDDNGTKRELKVPKGDVLHQFRSDVNNNKLPTVSWLTAPENFSDHPSAPWYGAWYVSEVLDILTQNPEVWKKTIFILTYDENDGYFDHIPPFVAPHSHKPGTGLVPEGMDTRSEFVTLEQEQERHNFPIKYDRESSIGLGYRVPMVIASPWSRGGWVNSEVFDHTSTLQFLEGFLSKKTGKKIHEPNITDWRRTICGDLTSAFRPYNGEKIQQPEFLAKDAVIEQIHKAKFKKLPTNYHLFSPEEIAAFNQNPHVSPFMAQQEKGIRPACALPYQLHVDGALTADKKAFQIIFDNRTEIFDSKTAGAPFNVYAPGKYLQITENGNNEMGDVRTWSYGTVPGHALTDSWPLHEFDKNNYHLRVYGPNGFFREFSGNAADPDLHIVGDYEHGLTKNKLTGNIVLKITNTGKKPHIIEVTDNAYKTNDHKKVLAANSTTNLVLNLTKSYNWYDFSIRIAGNNDFTKRYAGRVETGNPTQSDPFMGRVI